MAWVTRLKKSVAILQSVFIFPVVIYVVNIFWADAGRQPPDLIGTLVLVLGIAVSVMIHAGIWGSLIDIAAGKIILPEVPSLKSNAKAYWPVYFALTFLTFILLQVFLISSEGTVKGGGGYLLSEYFLFVFRPFVMFLFIWYGLGHKFKSLIAGNRPPNSGGMGDIPVLLLYLILGSVLIVDPEMTESSFVVRLFAFIRIYLELLMYIYIVLRMLERHPKIRQHFNPEKELYMINVAGGGILDAFSSLFVRLYPPAFVVLKALTPKNYSIRAFNRIYWHDRYYQPGKLVAITCYTTNCAEAYAMAKRFKECGSKVVMGGPHVTYLPDEALDHCDSVVVGEAESVWRDVVRDYENNALKKKYVGVPMENFSDEVHEELLNSPPVIIRDALETTRGCKFKCDFCTIPGWSEGKTRKRSIAQLVELIKKIKHKYKVVTFIDNNIYSDPEYAKELFRALKPLNIRWATQCTIDIAKNEETLRLAKESGCIAFLFGYEIAGDSAEQKQRGKFGLAERYIAFSRKVTAAGIAIKAHFILGFDSDRWQDLWNYWKFCLRLNPTFTVFSFLTPLPGSATYRQMMNEDRLLNLNWSSYSFRTLVFRHPHLRRTSTNIAFPFIYLFFLLTTCRVGYFMLTLVMLYGVIFYLSRIFPGVVCFT